MISVSRNHLQDFLVHVSDGGKLQKVRWTISGFYCDADFNAHRLRRRSCCHRQIR